MQEVLPMPNRRARVLTSAAEMKAPKDEESRVRMSPDIELTNGMRKEITQVLDGKFVKLYKLSRMSHEHFGLKGVSHNPFMEAPKFPAIDKVFASFSDDDFRLADRYQKPTLLLQPPGLDLDDILDAIALNHHAGVKGGPVISAPGLVTNPFQSTKEPPVQYQSFIAEGAIEMMVRPDDNDSLASSFVERIERRKAVREAEEIDGMREELYALLAAQSIVRGKKKMIDPRLFTILDGEDIVGKKYVPVGRCWGQRPAIERVPADKLPAGAGRFRRALGGRYVKI